MAHVYIVAMELVSRIDIDVEADSEDEAIDKAHDKLTEKFDSYRDQIKYGVWETEVVAEYSDDDGKEEADAATD
jgi:hypothetical protein